MSLRRMFHHKKGVIPGLLAAALLAPALAHAFEPFVVRDIRVEGIQRTDAGTVFGYLPVKVGEKFTDEEATEAVRRLYGTGFFSDVQIQTDNNVVVVVVQERPTIASISFNGMREFDSKAITKSLAQVGFGEGRIFDQSMLERAEYELKEQYLAKGKYGVEVTATVTPLPRNRVGVSFDVFEGEVAKIREIRVVGSKAFSEGELLDQFDLTTPGWLTWYTNTDKYSREKLEGDIERLRSFYLDQGYLEFTVEPPQVTISPDRKDIYITITVHEGEPYKVREVKLAGNLMGLDSEINNLVEIKPGEVFSAAKANNSAKAITNYLGDLGYAFANVNPNPQLDRAKHEADVTFYVDPSRRVYVRRIQIGGNTRTRDEVVRREMRQQEAAWYDAGDIKVSRDRVDRLGYFNEVNVKTDPVPGSPDQVDVNVDVKEKPTGIINLGVGYGSSEKAILSAGISEDNVFGSGTNLTLQLNTSKTNRAWCFRTPIRISPRTASAHHLGVLPRHRAVGQQRRRLPREGHGPGHELRRAHLRVRPDLPGRHVRAQPDRSVQQLAAGLSRLRRPVRQFDQRADLQHRLVQGHARQRAGADQGRVHAPEGRLLHNGSEVLPADGAAAVLPAAGPQLHAGPERHDRLRPQLRRPGLPGDQERVRRRHRHGARLRGASLGPRDRLTGDYIGGSRRMVANAQLYLPFPGASKDRTLRWFVFTDAGQVAAGSGMSCTAGKPDSEVEDPCGWRFSAGIGLSWQSPLGPLQLSYARPLNSKSGDDTQAFQFQIGTGF